MAKHPKGQIGLKPDGPEKLKVGDYMMWQTFKNSNLNPDASLRRGRPIFEYEILDPETSFSLILYLTDEMVHLDYMRARFMDIIRHEKSVRDFHHVKIQEFKYGWYPSGGVTITACRDRVDFVGDAGSWTTPCGWGMGFVLQNYKSYAHGLAKLIREDRLDQKSLEGLLKLKSYQKTQFMLNKLATYFLSNANAKQLDKFIELFNSIPPVICEKMFTLKITPFEVVRTLAAILRKFSLSDIAQIIPREEYFSIFKDILRLAMELVPETFKWLLRINRERKRDFSVFGH